MPVPAAIMITGRVRSGGRRVILQILKPGDGEPIPGFAVGR